MVACGVTEGHVLTACVVCQATYLSILRQRPVGKGKERRDFEIMLHPLHRRKRDHNNDHSIRNYKEERLADWLPCILVKATTVYWSRTERTLIIPLSYCKMIIKHGLQRLNASFYWHTVGMWCSGT